METRMTNKQAKLLVESVRDSIKELRTDGEELPNFALEFSISMRPGLVTDSEALSYLDKLLGALSKFAAEEPAHFVLNIPVVPRTQELLENRVQEKFEAVMKIEAAPSALVGANGAPLNTSK